MSKIKYFLLLKKFSICILPAEFLFQKYGLLQNGITGFNIRSIINTMQKTPYLSSSILLSQIQSRLAKNSYLSTQNMPSSADAQVFLAIQKIKKIPNRQSHPNLYYWFIIMKQFAHRTLEIWIKRGQESDFQDQLIEEFIFESNLILQGVSHKKRYYTQQNNRFLTCLELNKENSRKMANLHKKIERRRTSTNYAQLHENANIPQRSIQKSNDKNSIKNVQKQASNNSYCSKNEVFIPIFENQYIIQMELVIENNTCLQQLRANVAQQSLQIITFKMKNGNRIQIVAQVEAIQYDKVKNRLSQWPQIVKICFRKDRKRTQHQIRSEKCINSPTKRFQQEQIVLV